MADFRRVYRIGTARTYGGRAYSVYVRAEYKDGKLSISGVEGPTRGGNCLGVCGQINMHDWNITKYAPGWSTPLECKLRTIWSRWHLNAMLSMCPHQQERGETYDKHGDIQCPQCGWQLGHGWRMEAVPESVLQLLRTLPETDRKPAWI